MYVCVHAEQQVTKVAQLLSLLLLHWYRLIEEVENVGHFSAVKSRYKEVAV